MYEMLVRGRASLTSGSPSQDASSHDAAHDDGVYSAQFSSLPTETKARIVFFACVCDREHKEYRERSSAREVALIAAVETPFSGRSVYALSEVCKELNALCALHIFKTLSSTQAGASLLVREILPKYTKLIRTLDLTANFGGAKKAFMILPLLANLTELRLSGIFAHWAFGEVSSGDASDSDSDPDTDEENNRANWDIRTALFRQGTRAVETIYLETFTTLNLSNTISNIGHLRTLTLREIVASQCREPGGLAAALAKAPHLCDLTLNKLFLPKITANWSSSEIVWPALEALSLREVSSSTETFRFVDTFARTLSSLHISFSPPSHTTTDPTVARPVLLQPFPLLRILHLVNLGLLTATHILEDLAATKAPLQRIDLELVKPDSASTTAPFFSALTDVTRHQTLRELRIVQHKNHLRVFEGVYYPRSIKVSPPRRSDYFFSRIDISTAQAKKDQDGGAGHRTRVKAFAKVLRQTLEFGLDHLKDLEDQEDLVGIDKGFEMLEKLHVWQKVLGK